MFSVTTNTYIFFVNYENSCKGKIKSAYMQIFFHFFLILCAFFLFTIFEGLRARACVLLNSGFSSSSEWTCRNECRPATLGDRHSSS